MADLPPAELTAGAHRCQEASFKSESHYIPCNRPARHIVIADGQETRMCDACAWHSSKNRGMSILREYGTAEGETLLPDIGGNSPPDPIDEISAAYDDTRAEAENWLDGTAVDSEGQMNAVDKLRKAVREWRLALDAGQKSAAAPLYEVYKAELARWKPTIEDAQRIEKGLVALVDGFKRKLAAEKEAARKAAEAKAWEETRKAQDAARLADASNIEATRAAAAQIAAAEEAQRLAKIAAKDTVVGLKTYHMHEILDHRGVLHWIAKNDRDALTGFITEYVNKNAKAFPSDLVRNYTEKRAF